MNKDTVLQSITNNRFYCKINYYKTSIIDFASNNTIAAETKDSYGWVCWGEFTNKLNYSNIYKDLDMDICIVVDPIYLSRIATRHYCFFTREEIISYLDLISKEYEFEYSLSELNNKISLVKPREINYENYTLNIKIPGIVRKVRILWILNLIRHIYEFPFNVFLRDALKLKELDEFKKEHIANLLQVVASVANGRKEHSREDTYFIKRGNRHMHKGLYSTDQSLGWIYSRLISEKTIMKNLNKCNLFVCEVYRNSLPGPKSKTIDRAVDFLPEEVQINNKQYPINSYGYWFMAQDWETDRFKCYKKYYKFAKTRKHKKNA